MLAEGVLLVFALLDWFFIHLNFSTSFIFITKISETVCSMDASPGASKNSFGPGIAFNMLKRNSVITNNDAREAEYNWLDGRWVGEYSSVGRVEMS